MCSLEAALTDVGDEFFYANVWSSNKLKKYRALILFAKNYKKIHCHFKIIHSYSIHIFYFALWSFLRHDTVIFLLVGLSETLQHAYWNIFCVMLFVIFGFHNWYHQTKICFDLVTSMLERKYKSTIKKVRLVYVQVYFS